MDLSQELYKRANRIQELSQGLLHPYESVRKFADDLGVSGLGEPPIHQITPSESFKAEENPDSIPTENVDSIAKKTIQKLVDYISGNISADEGVLYNDLKAWYKSLGDIINENNIANPSNSLDRGQLTQKIKTITLSGDPNTYKEIDVDVSPEVALKIQEINGKAISSKGGNTKEDAAEGGNTTAENMEAAAKIQSFVKQAMGEQELSEEDKNLIKQNPNLQNAITQAPGSNNNSILKQEVDKIKNPQNTNPLQPTIQASDFWNFVKTANVVGDLDKVFLSWASGKFSSVEEIGIVWANVYNEVNTLFKKANLKNVFSTPGVVPNFDAKIHELLSQVYAAMTKSPDNPIGYEPLNTYISTFISSNLKSFLEELSKAFISIDKSLNTNKDTTTAQAANAVTLGADFDDYISQKVQSMGLTDQTMIQYLNKNVFNPLKTHIMDSMLPYVDEYYDLIEGKN